DRRPRRHPPPRMRPARLDRGGLPSDARMAHRPVRRLRRPHPHHPGGGDPMTTDVDAQHQADRLELLHSLDQHPAEAIPCRAVDLYVSAAWTAEDDAEQRTAAAACRARPCPAIE